MPNTIQEKDADFINQAHIHSDEIDLRELFSILWAGKLVIIAVTFLFAVAGIGTALWLPNIYESEATLAPAEESQSGGLSALANQFGGLASFAGLNLGGGNNDKTALAIEVIKSRKFVSDFIERHDLLPELMAVKKWDNVSNQLIYDSEIYDVSNKKWTRSVTLPKKSEPSMQEAYKVFSKKLNIKKDSETGLIKISIEHQSPYVAKKWVDWIIEDINETMKKRDVSEAYKSKKYLTELALNTNVTDITSVLYKLIEEQTKTIMFANVRDEYVFSTIDPAIVSEDKTKPKRAIIFGLSIILGIIFGVIFVFFRKKIV